MSNGNDNEFEYKFLSPFVEFEPCKKLEDILIANKKFTS